MSGSGAWQVLVSCSRHLESSLWCVADALVYGLHLFFRWFLGLSSLLGSRMEGTQLLLLCERKTFTSPRHAARGHVFNITSHQQCTTGPQTRGELFGGNCEIYSESALFPR